MSIQNTSAAARRNDDLHNEDQGAGKTPPSRKAAQANEPEARKSAPSDFHAELDAAEKDLNAYSQKYDQKADGKAGVQKAMDWVRKGFNEGYGDDQFKNIGKTREALGALRKDLDSNKISQAEARDKLGDIRGSFNSEEKRVTEAQGDNAKVGQAVHGAGRVGVVTLSGLGATAASGGNVFVGFAAATGAGSLYDAATVADQGKSEIAPKLDSGNSLGGVAAQGLKGEKIDGGDWARGGLGSAIDGVNGAFVGQGMLSAKAAQISVQQAAAQSGTQASRMALGNAVARSNVLNTAAQTGTTYGMKTLGTAADSSLTQLQKRDQIGQSSAQTLKQLPGQLAFGALSSHLGVSAQMSNPVMDKGVQAGLDGATNLAQTSIGNAIDGKGLGLSKADLAAASVQTGTGTVQNLTPRVPQRTAQEVSNDIGTMHPYTGTARSSVPEHHDGSTVVVGRLQDLQGDTAGVPHAGTASQLASSADNVERPADNATAGAADPVTARGTRGEAFNPYDLSHLDQIPSSLHDLPPDLLNRKMNGDNPPTAFVSPDDGSPAPRSDTSSQPGPSRRPFDVENMPTAFNEAGRLKDPYAFVDAISQRLNPTQSTYGNCGDIAQRVGEVLNSRGEKANLSPIESNNPAGSMGSPIDAASGTKREISKPGVLDEKLEAMRSMMQDGRSFELSIYDPGLQSLYGGIPDHQINITLNDKNQVVGIDAQRRYVIEEPELRSLLQQVEGAFEVHPSSD
jgi:hypothetical protein